MEITPQNSKALTVPSLHIMGEVLVKWEMTVSLSFLYPFLTPSLPLPHPFTNPYK